MAKSAKQRYEALKYEVAARKLEKVLAKYDAVDASTANRKRRQATIETESDEDILTKVGRYRSVSLARDLQRNYVDAAAHLRQFRNAAVGIGPKLALQTSDESINEEWSAWFNSEWAHNCDARGNLSFRTLVALVLLSVKREGDVVVMFDDVIFDDGRLWFWEADQMCELSKADWGKQTQFPASQGYTQADGVVSDKFGRTVGYIVTWMRGTQIVPLADATILPTTVARLIQSPWRLNQRRGVSEMLTPGAMYQDSYEIISKELQSAKVAASIAGVVKRREGAEMSLLGQGIDPEAIVDSTASSVVTTAQASNYDNLESLTGGIMEYLDPDDEFQILNWNRPNINVKDFCDRAATSAGASMGLSKTYSTLTPAGSYTAFRGDMILGWAQFEWDQKDMEQYLCDWVATKALNWAIRKRAIKRTALKWANAMSWIWPQRPAVDELKDTQATTEKLSNFSTDLSAVIGPNWKRKLAAIFAQSELLEKYGFTWPSKATAPQPQEPDSQDQEEQQQEEDDGSNNLR